MLAIDAQSGIEFIEQMAPELEVDADSEQLFRVIHNLCRNAVQALTGRCDTRTRWRQAHHGFGPARRQRRQHHRRRHRPRHAAEGQTEPLRRLPRLRPLRRHGPRPGDRPRTGAGPWRHDRACGKALGRNAVSHRDSGPPGIAGRLPQPRATSKSDAISASRLCATKVAIFFRKPIAFAQRTL